MSTTKAELLKTIRRKCMDCTCDQMKEVELCPMKDCPLWPFRMGKDPYKTCSPGRRQNLQKAWAANQLRRENEHRQDEELAM